ncbi:MAG: HDOD domain-containing protein [Deltaproteobacteria bacterium]|nr:HDOD domain-containing protein [Deltaproteobacteria bacterium]
MLQWLLSLLGIQPRPTPATPPARKAPEPTRAFRPPPEEKPAEAPAEPASSPARTFLVSLCAEGEAPDLQDMAADDRVFLAGVLKRVRENQLVIPLLPQAAMEISRLLANPNSHMDEFVRVLEADPSLSVEVLRIANSAFYGFSGPTQSVHNAVRRIGLNQIRGLIIVAHLHGKVLQGGGFQVEASVLVDLSLALAQLGQELASWLGVEPDAAYTRGVLSHVEHFVIMGAVSDVSRDHQRRIAPTQAGLLEAFRRCGPSVRELTAKAWGLDAVMLDAPGGPPVRTALGQLERAVVSRWTGEAVGFDVGTLPAERLAAGLRRVQSSAMGAGQGGP